jgi:hypothetical protein
LINEGQQTSDLIKASNSTTQRLVNAVVGAMKINSQEIARPAQKMNLFLELSE